VVHGDGYKIISSRNLDIFKPGEEGQRNDLRRNIITVKIISRQPDEARLKNNELQQK